ncbi:Protein of unknown function [Jatrophihabitans endophyticus]|uniref:DUF3152 domain-containing protein n=1 Tax=Jatrophihabitans endophyticus TaxID=1206085 RepID=A0A1M5EU00_9ACTN|nr:DUF3152 domain-containing protein [Jatrophihabitans endophyticus]SHF82687.1 Protein of unknown function [Jatrophihabitans endophyticus]
MTAGRPDDRPDDVAVARAHVRNARASYGAAPQQGRAVPLGDRLRLFVRRYGWRAYALPILFLLTVAALLTTSTSSSGGGQTPAAEKQAPFTPRQQTPPTASSHIPLKGDDKGQISNDVLKAAQLPAGAAYTKKGNGSFRVLPGSMAKVGRGTLYRYSIDVEGGVSGVDLDQFESLVDKTMSDPRSWAGHGVAVQRVSSWKGIAQGANDFHVTLTSAMTVRKYCGYDIPVETSCFQGAGKVPGLSANRVFFNISRWVRGAPAYLGDLDAYRVYMINHENGHALGHNHAHECLPGGLAPVMMQQTFGLRATKGGTATGKLCAANPWPYPTGAKGAPGSEQVDTAENNEYGRGD